MHARNRTWPLGQSPEERCRQRILPIEGGDGSTLSLDFTTGVLDPRLTFTRLGNATFINSSGLVEWAAANMMTYSQAQDNNSFWNAFGTSVTRTASQTDPFGGTGAVKLDYNATSGDAVISRTVSVDNGVQYTLSVWLRADSGTITNVRLGRAATAAGATFPTLTTTWQRFSITFTASGTTDGIELRVLTSGSPKTASFHVFGAQLEPGGTARTYQPALAATAYQAPRFDHDPTTLAPKGLLIEASATNLTAYSDGLNQSPWFAACNVVRTTSTGGTAPDGTNNTASRISMSAAIINCSSLYYNGVTVTNQQYTHSVFAKADGADWIYLWVETSGSVANGAYFNLTGNGSVGNLVGSGTTARIEKFPNGWYRCQTTSTQPAGTTYPCMLPSTGNLTGRSSMVGTTPGNILVWGDQFEAGSGASSYIPTGSGQGTRNADECSMTGTNFSSWFNATEGAFLAHARRMRTTDVGRIASANDNTANESIDIGASTTGQFIVTDGGSALATITPGTVTANTAFKIAGAFKLNDVQAALGGTLGTADTGVTMPTVNQLMIGRQAGASPVYLNGTVSLLKFWPTRLPDSQLQSLTT